MSSSTQMRTWLVYVAAALTLMGVGYLGTSSAHRWYPEAVGVLALVAALSFVGLAWAPGIEWLYRFAGTVGIAALLANVVSVFIGLSLVHDTDAPWITLVSMGITAIVVRLFWSWWLGPVKVWHSSGGSP